MKRERIVLFIPQRFATNPRYTGGNNVVAHVINEHFATIDIFGCERSKWRNLTHRHTGGHICNVRTDRAAQRVVDRLMAIDGIDWSDRRVPYFMGKWQELGHVIQDALKSAQP